MKKQTESAVTNRSTHKIQWLNIPGYRGESWNPIIGCSKVSDGCKNCYAEKMAWRLANIETTLYYMNVVHKHPLDVNYQKWNGKTRFVESAIDKPLRWKKPRVIFVCSMGDLFHEDTPSRNIDEVMAVAALCPQHIFIILTKRARLMESYFNHTKANHYLTKTCNQITDKYIRPLEQALYLDDEVKFPLPNVWLGVTAENQKTADERIPLLLQTPAAVRFVSVEPILSSINFESALGYTLKWHAGGLKNCLSWVICGGESGHHARPMHPDWARSLRDQCQAAGVPFFFKQWGEWMPSDQYAVKWAKIKKMTYFLDATVLKVGRKAAGNLLDGERWEQRAVLHLCGETSPIPAPGRKAALEGV